MYVYFMRDTFRDAMKIGISTTPHVRRANLATASAGEIELVGCIEGGREREKELHDQFASKRMAGEWFRVDDDLLSAIAVILGRERVEAPKNGVSGMRSDDPYVTVTTDAIDRMTQIFVERGETRTEAYRLVGVRCGLGSSNVENLRRKRRAGITIQEYNAVQDALRILLREELERVNALLAWVLSSTDTKPAIDVEGITASLKQIEAVLAGAAR